MPVFQRKDLPEFLRRSREQPPPVCLIFGERYLCREAADALVAQLLPEGPSRAQNLKVIDGEQEGSAGLLVRLRTFSLFGGRQVFRVTGLEAFDADNRESGQLLGALEAGLPAGNLLVLVTEAVDKRHRLYKYIDKHGLILDLTVERGGSSAARQEQETLLRELAEKSFASLGKKLEPRALPVLLERVGFHPVAVVMESEKLALHAGDAPLVTLKDLDLLLGRTREEALFEFTDAVGRRDLIAALVSFNRLRESQLHGLVMVAGLRNLFKKLLLAKAFQEQASSGYRRGMAFPVFQKGCLAQIKESSWASGLAGHPFVIYKIFRQAENFTSTVLRKALARLLEAEYRLKSSPLAEDLVLQAYLFQLFQEEGGRSPAASRS